VTYPVLPVIMPTGLQGCKNGELPTSVLRNINPVGRLYKTAATAFNCLQLSAFFAGVSVNPISSPDTYRTLAQQKAAFLDRFQPTPAGRVPEITRVYEGKVWYLKQGNYVPVASPGTSNHGFGLAVDIKDCWVGSKTLTWLLGDGSLGSQALRYGFSWEVADGPQAESWHIRYVCGDALTADAQNAIAAFPQLDVR
jgi:LAS superfamily LD-carboxypeptidase LdcB